MRLNGKIALITGASSGIGRAMAAEFAREGAMLVVCGRNESALSSLIVDIKEANGTAIKFRGDIADPDFAEQSVGFAVSEYGGLDIAVNNAGILGGQQPIEDMSLHTWEETLKTNLTSSFLAAKHQVPELRKSRAGSLIFTSSFVGHTVGFAGYGDYAASKAGIIGLTKVLAAELGSSNIRVNALLPGGTVTPMNTATGADAPPEAIDYVKGIHALGRLAEPSEIARAAVFLASNDASFVTGTAMLVDGGVSIFRG